MIESNLEWPQKIYVLIPAYKSANTLRPFLPALLETVPADHICIVDDGSFDGTNTLCATMGLLYRNHPRNRGKGAALTTGFESLLGKGAEAIITLDADGQHSVDDLPAFLNVYAANPEAGIIIGRRNFKSSRMPFSRVLSNTLTSKALSLITGITILDSQCGYRLYSGGFLRSITITCPRFEMESEVIIKATRLGFPVLFTEVQTLYLNGQSHISHIIDTFRWIKAVIAISFSVGKSRR